MKVKELIFKMIQNLKKNDDFTFCETLIEKISIPSQVTEIGEAAFCDEFIKRIYIPEDSKLSKIGKEAFVNTFFKSISLPSKSIIIGEGTFSNYSIKIIEFGDNSMIKYIESALKGISHEVIVMIPEIFSL